MKSNFQFKLNHAWAKFYISFAIIKHQSKVRCIMILLLDHPCTYNYLIRGVIRVHNLFVHVKCKTSLHFIQNIIK